MHLFFKSLDLFFRMQLPPVSNIATRGQRYLLREAPHDLLVGGRAGHSEEHTFLRDGRIYTFHLRDDRRAEG